jgi:type II secretory pathway pseudopilin PulG
VSGFTLIETVLTVGIIAALGAAIAVGWPRVRAHQGIVLATEHIQSWIYTAQEKSLNEERPDACVNLFTTLADKRRCSDVGIALRDNEMIMFADTDGNNDRYTNNDFIIDRTTLVSPVVVDTPGPTWDSFLFRAVPPGVVLHGKNGQPIGTGSNDVFRLESGPYQIDINVLPYGLLQPQ